jgi:segregation and condensation protein A
MAAMLLEIKSRMLLPRPKKVEEEEALDPRAELVRRLLEYEQMKAAAAKIDALPQAMRDYQWVSIWITDEVAERLPDVNLHDLQVAWLSLMKHAKVMQHHKVRREELSVREHMSIILRKLQGGTFLEFAELFDLTLGVAGLVVNFLAVLELTRERLVEVTQREVFAPIYVKLAQSATGSNDVDFPTVHA